MLRMAIPGGYFQGLRRLVLLRQTWNPDWQRLPSSELEEMLRMKHCSDRLVLTITV
jgi:hypothetical protein